MSSRWIFRNQIAGISQLAFAIILGVSWFCFTLDPAKASLIGAVVIWMFRIIGTIGITIAIIFTASIAVVFIYEVFRDYRYNRCAKRNLCFECQRPLCAGQGGRECAHCGKSDWRLMLSLDTIPPPWEAFAYEMAWGGWRQGAGEGYRDEWFRFFASLDQSARDAYRHANPEPVGWEDFYKFTEAAIRRPHCDQRRDDAPLTGETEIPDIRASGTADTGDML